MEHCVVNQTDYKCQKLGSDICISANIVSIIVNIIHIFVIQRITAFSGDVYKKIVLVQSTQDILVAVSHCVTVSCYIQQSIINIDSHGLRLAAAIMKSVFGKGLTTSRYSFFCVALTDRYLAFCKPLQYCGLWLLDISTNLLRSHSYVRRHTYWVWHLFMQIHFASTILLGMMTVSL